MRKSLAQPEALEEIRTRLATLTAADTAKWGRLTVGGMVCHLTDAYRVPLGEVRAATVPQPPVARAMVKFFALRAPMQWPKGIKTMPEVEQGVGGTAPSDFASDMEQLRATFELFAAHTGPWPKHPIFGEMSEADWKRWGYLHPDHHLRQFGR